MKNAYRIFAVPSGFAAAVRAGRVRSVRTLDGGRHQCRHCLTLSAPDEAVLLVSYSPFGADQPYAERGPVFVHERECPRWRPEEGYPPEFPKRSAVLRAYDADEAQLESRVVGDARIEDVLAGLFADSRTAFVHARNVAEGCFMFRIEPARETRGRFRAGGGPPTSAGARAAEPSRRRSRRLRPRPAR